MRSAEDFHAFLTRADHRVYLESDSVPRLGVGFDPGCWWHRGDRVYLDVPFGPSDRPHLVDEATYRFVPRNEAEGSRWRVAEGASLVRRG